MTSVEFKKIKEFTDKSLGFPSKKSPLILRKAARTVILNEEGDVALMRSNKRYLKLPGGGLNHGESAEDAAKRETREEVGRSFKIDATVCMTVEHRSRTRLLQLSYVFLGHAHGVPKKTKLSKTEKAQGFRPVWHTPNKALKLLRGQIQKRTSYNGIFMSNRDLFILKTALKMIKR